MNKINLIKQVEEVRNSPTRQVIEKRLEEFKSFKHKKSGEWFAELCFCLLTANSKAKTAIQIHKELGFMGFSEHPEEALVECIKRNKHRFHNNKAKYIVEARQHLDVQWIIQGVVHDEGSLAARDWLVENVKGLGFKEASHFLRNVGYFDRAVLDRHILNILVDNNYLKEKPKSLSRKKYIEIEQVLQNICDELEMSQAELDLYLWYIKTGEVLR